MCECVGVEITSSMRYLNQVLFSMQRRTCMSERLGVSERVSRRNESINLHFFSFCRVKWLWKGNIDLRP
jgi:hypothetical protein